MVNRGLVFVCGSERSKCDWAGQKNAHVTLRCTFEFNACRFLDMDATEKETFIMISKILFFSDCFVLSIPAVFSLQTRWRFVGWDDITIQLKLFFMKQ